MKDVTKLPDFSERDTAIHINSYTTVRRCVGVREDIFDHYWRDVHGPLCSRLSGIGWYVQHHFNREQDGHLWPLPDGVHPIPNYALDGMAEIGFASAVDQKRFSAMSPILFADEQNVFEETVAYDLPNGSRTFVDHIPDPIPNEEDDGVDRLHVHFHAAHGDTQAFRNFMTGFVASLVGHPSVLKLRLHLPEPHDNAVPNPPSPDVKHSVEPSRITLAILEIAFPDPLSRRKLFASDLFQASIAGQRKHVRNLTAFAVGGVFTFVRDGKLTTAGLRGSRPAALIKRLGSNNQIALEVEELFR
jgi:EthD domain